MKTLNSAAQIGLLLSAAITFCLPTLSLEKSKTVTKEVKVTKKTTLIPPPPPEAALITGSYLPGGNAPLEYLNLAELEKLQANTQADLDKLGENLSQIRKNTSEKKERSQLFESLFKEGVVSRKELEQAKSEGSTADTDILEAENKVIETEAKLKAITKYIGLKKNKKTTSTKEVIKEVKKTNLPKDKAHH